MPAHSLNASNEGNRSLEELDDAALITHWAAVRNQLALTPASSPDHPGIKSRYQAVLSEYRRRIDDGTRSDR